MKTPHLYKLFSFHILLTFSLVTFLPYSARAEAGLDFQGRVVEVVNGKAIVTLEAGAKAAEGDVVFLYRYYDRIPDALTQQVRSGETWIGRGMLQQVENGRGMVEVPFLDVLPRDIFRVVDPWVASTVANDAWVPEGIDKLYLQEPFMVPRVINNRIQVTTEGARLGKEDPSTGVGDYYYGTTIDFTFWPMLYGTPLGAFEYIRFGASGFQGQTPDEAPEDGLDTTLVRFISGFAETDVKLGNYMAVAPSLKLGLNNAGFGFGGGLKLRIGSAQNSHFLTGFEYSRVVGGLAFMEFHHFFTRRAQVWVKSGIENLPAGGARGAGKIQLGGEYQLTKALWLKAAVGMGGRRSTEERERGINGLLGFSYNFMTGAR